MIWRAAYQTRTLETTALPKLPVSDLYGTGTELPTRGILIGGFGLASLPAVDMWRRLLASSESRLIWIEGILHSDWTARLRHDLSVILPPSRHEEIRLFTDHHGAWEAVLVPDLSNWPFAMLYHQDEAIFVCDLGMIGPATEDAWERFEAEASRF